MDRSEQLERIVLALVPGYQMDGGRVNDMEKLMLDARNLMSKIDEEQIQVLKKKIVELEAGL